MICPRCQQEVPEGPDCAACGVVISKFLARQEQHVVEPVVAPGDKVEPRAALSAASAPGLKARQLFYRQLARMLDSGLSLDESLELLARHSRKRLADRLRGVVGRLRAGDGLAAASRSVGGLFDEIGLALIEAGEATGALPASLNALAASAELEQDLKRQLLRSLIYPFVIFTLVFFVPKAYLVISAGWIAYLLACLVPYLVSLAILGGFFWGLPRLAAAVLGRDRYRGLLKRIPGIGGVMKRAAALRFCRHLAGALGAGLELRASLRLSSRAAQDRAWRRAAEQVEKQLAQGSSLHEALLKTGMVDEDLNLVLVAGERSGRLAEALAEYAEVQQATLQHRLQVKVQLLAIGVLLLTYLFVVMSIKSEYESIFGGLQTKLDGLMDGRIEGLLDGESGADLDRLIKELGGRLPPELRDVLK